MTDPFKAAAAGLKKTVQDLRDAAKVKYDHAQGLDVEAKTAAEESELAVGQWKSAEKRLAAFLGEDAPAAPAAPKAAAKTVAKKATKKATKKRATKKKTAKKKSKKAVTKKKATAKKATAKKAAAKTVAKKANGATKSAKPTTDRPVWREAMAIVMGKKAMNAAQVLAGLTERGWPPNAGDPRQYVSFMLSSNKETFKRVEGKRGVYTVRADATFGKRKKAKATAKKSKVTAKATVKKAAPKDPDPKPDNSGQVDATLNGLGLQEGNVAANPFAG